MAGLPSNRAPRWRPLLAALCAAAGLMLASAPSGASPPSPMTTDWIDPPAFATAPVGTTREHACMPANRADSDPQLHLAGPRRVTLQAADKLVVPVCARGIIPVTTNMPPPAVVATDKATGKVYRGIAYQRKRPQPRGMDIDIAPGSVPPRDTPIEPGVSVGTQFSTDVAAAAGLPKQEAVYEVYVEANGLRSNAVTIEVRAAE
ncbi:hypothetical protein D9M68_527600 [compost metagenome]